MSFSPALSRSHFMQGVANELVAAMRHVGLADAQIKGTLNRFGPSLVRRFGGHHGYVPRGRGDANENAAKALALKQQGISTADIAERMGFTPRYVQKLISKARAQRA